MRKDPQEEEHKEKLVNVRLFMDQKNIPHELYDRIIRYYEFQYKKKRQNSVSSQIDLPRSLRIEVANANYREIIDKCVPTGRTLAGCKDHFLNSMLLKLHVSFFQPGDQIVKRDDLPRELFFVLSGSVQVIVLSTALLACMCIVTMKHSYVHPTHVSIDLTQNLHIPKRHHLL